MRRVGKVNWRRIGAKADTLPVIAIGAIFIGASGVMSVTFGYRLGEPSGTGLIIAAIAIGIEGWADLSVPLLWHKSRLLGRVLLIGFFGLCLCYKLEASKQFAAENLGKREATVAGAALDYQLAHDKVEGLRKVINANADARSTEAINAEIALLLRDPKTEGCPAGKPNNGRVTGEICPKVDKLRGELARANDRDQAQKDLAPAIAALRTLAPVSTATAQHEAGGPVVAALAFAGVTVSWSGLMSSLIMAIVEFGAIVVPMVVGFASRETRKPTSTGESSQPTTAPAASENNLGTGEGNPPQTFPAGLTDRSKRDIADLTAFLADACEQSPADCVQSTPLFDVYGEWKRSRGEKPMSSTQFGTLLPQHLGVPKIKREGKNFYLGIRLRHPQQGRKVAKTLRAAKRAKASTRGGLVANLN